jgi:purine-cytosine permease-like protein
VLPAGLNSVTAGFGWFAVNSVSGAFALSALTSMPVLAALLIVVLAQVLVAFFGHNLVHAFEKYALVFLGVVFLMASVVLLAKAHPTAATQPVPGGFLLTVGAAFGYAAGWNPYAADYTRYLPAAVNPRAVGMSAALGLFVSTTLLMLVGAASVTIGGSASGNPTAAFTGHLPGALAAATLLAVTLGAVAANVLNIYSGALAFLALGIRLPLAWRRAVVALGFGTVGFVLAWLGLADAGHAYEGFLLVIAYWISPWLAVVLVDQYLRRGTPIDDLLADTGHRNRAGTLAFVIGAVVSVGLFANQSLYTGPVPDHFPWVGDSTFLVGFLVAGGLYALLGRRSAATAGSGRRRPAGSR